jgi:hypothetical protein
MSNHENHVVAHELSSDAEGTLHDVCEEAHAYEPSDDTEKALYQEYLDAMDHEEDVFQQINTEFVESGKEGVIHAQNHGIERRLEDARRGTRKALKALEEYMPGDTITERSTMDTFEEGREHSPEEEEVYEELVRRENEILEALDDIDFKHTIKEMDDERYKEEEIRLINFLRGIQLKKSEFLYTHKNFVPKEDEEVDGEE